MKRLPFQNYFKRALPLLLSMVIVAGNSARLAQAQSVTSSDAVRFLEQVSFGPRTGLISRVQTEGFKSFLEEEYNARISGYPGLTPFPSDSSVGCPTGSDPNCFRDNYTMYPLQVAFFLNSLYGEDQFRQRVAFALGQIFVVSGVTIQQPSSMGPFLNLLHFSAFGNFHQLLYDVTLNPAMGNYLNMVNNDRRSGGASPNENYAREVLQLFSIGLYKLNLDGTVQLDGTGNPIPTYDQNTVIGFAKAFTGWTYAPNPGAPMLAHNPENYQGPMVAWENNHDKTTKTLLDGVVMPANQAAKKDLVNALNNIFNHPNVGPFISKQLIQHLVTSNPSPAYVARIASVFNNNGSGVRGDLKAVVSAIVLDAEARGDTQASPSYGHLREPVLFITNVLRAFDATSDGVALVDRATTMGQNLFNSPSVFNYYRPSYQVPGAGILGPEFNIQTTSATLSRANFVNTMVFSRIGTAPAGTQLNLGPWQTLASNPSALVDELNRLLMHGTMSTAMRDKVVTTVGALPGVTSNDLLLRARWAIYLVATSQQYQVER